jgi:hypothetical protein
VTPENLARLDAFPRSYQVDPDVELPGGSGGEPVHYVRGDLWGVARDGMLLRLSPEGGVAWLGMFAGCWHVSACPHPFQFLAWGPENSVLGDVRDPTSFRAWGPWPLLRTVAAPAARRLVALGWRNLDALGPDGPVWERSDSDLEDVQAARVEDDVLHVVAIAVNGILWEARLDLATGAYRSRLELPGPDLSGR